MVRVINLLADGPAYDSLLDPSLLLREWELPDSKRTANGNDNREWPAQIGPWVLRQCPDWSWEVWQPDAGADRIYTHVFNDGVVHRLFPAERRAYVVGVRRRWALRSEALLARLELERRHPYVLVLHGLGPLFWGDVLGRLAEADKVPIYLIGHGSGLPLRTRLAMTRHPVSILELLADHARRRKEYRRLDGMSAPDEINVAAARSVYDGRIDRLTMGCDFDFWVPPPDTGSRKAARDALAVPRARKLFLTVGRLSPSKRVDALLRAFRALGDRRDFTLLIVGQGDPRYVRYLRDIAGTMLTDGRVVFHAHATGIQLRRLYWAADVFVSGSRSEGGPVTIMEAMACGLPIIATPVGRTFEAMGGFGPGNTLAVRDPNSWPDVLRAALDQAGLRPVDREMARNHFDWRIIGQRLVAILSNITERRGTNAGSVGQPLSLDTTDPCPL